MPSQFKGIINRISFSKLFKFFEKHTELMNRLVYFVSFLALLSGMATYGALSEIPPFGTIHPDTVFWLLTLDLIFLLLLGFLVARRVVSLWIQKKKGMAGSTIHIRLVMIFSLLAVLPAIFMGVFAVVFYHYGVESWFGDRISTAVTESREVAQSYLTEHRQTIRADILAMANDMNRDAAVLTTNSAIFTKFIKTQSFLRNFTEITVFDENRKVIASGLKGEGATHTALPPPSIIKKAEKGEVVIITGASANDQVHALVRLNNYSNTYLYVGRNIEEGVLKHIALTERAVQDYTEIEGRQHSFKITMAFIFIMVSLLLLLVAVTLGLIFAEHLVRPIGALVDATERVRAGDMKARVAGEERTDETGVLARAFNRMTEQLSNQRHDLINANKQIDDRRRFTEAVLSGISAGILSMDEEGHITLANHSATELIGSPGEDIIGRKLSDVSPEMEKLRRAARRKPDRVLESEITLVDETNGQTQTWVVRMSAESDVDVVKRYVATFDNVTPLMNAQRKAAWSGVARRIAHEIKNPLTPIQLSAERLRKKYMDQITDDPETFDMCTNTIIRHVADIGRMVDEFSSFARMPTAQKRQENLSTVARQVLFLFQQGHPDIEYNFTDLPEAVRAECDSRQISQALTNLLKNATESVDAAREKTPTLQGKVTFSMTEQEDGNIVVAVNDNGLGLPKNLSGKLTDPYVTTREKGTGLGLAIVSKIMEDHDGYIDLTDNSNQTGGATAKLIFPKKVGNK